MRKRGLFSAVVGLMVLLSFGLSYGQSQQITNGLVYLSTSQNADGSWGGDTSSAELLPSTVSVMETLQLLGQTNDSNYSNALSWLQAQGLDTTDYLSERIRALSIAGTDDDLLLSYLDEFDYAWGGYDDFDVNTFDTALALQALRTVNYSDSAVISSAIAYLLSSQNPDGGWGFCQSSSLGCADGEGDSTIYMTALVSSTLQQFPQTTAIATAINTATAYLLSNQNADGGFGAGTSPALTSTVFETAYAYIALVGVTTDNTVLGNAVNYLTSTQLSDGSWADDPYSTALALRALYYSENKPTPPPSPTSGTITGRVVDASTSQPLSAATVALESDPDLNVVTDLAGTFTMQNVPQGGQTIIFSSAGYSSSSVAITVTAGSIVNLGTVSLSANPTTGIIKGTVTDVSSGQALAGVTITVSGSFNANAETGPDGTFMLSDVTPGAVTLTASSPGYFTVGGSGTVTAGGILFFNPQLSTSPPAATTGDLTGKVLDSATMLPIQGATISISGGSSAGADAQGVFLIPGISPGQCEATISAPGYTSQVFQIMIMAGITTDMQIVYLASSPQTTTVTGKVTDATTGTPIAGATVAILGTSNSTQTDQNGNYALSGIADLQFIIKGSFTGYDSQIFSVTGTYYGTYKIDFSLTQSLDGSVKIAALATDKQSYPANDAVTIDADLENTDSMPIDVLVNAQIMNQDNNLVTIISQPVDPALRLEAGGTATVSLQWDTGQSPPGTYGVILSVVDATKGILLGEGYTSFQITPTTVIGGLVPLLSPKFLNVTSTETVNLSASLNNRSNVESDLTAEYEIKDPGGNVIDNGTTDFTVTPSEPFKVVELTSFAYSFAQSGQYPVTVRILSGDSLVAESTDAIYVAPSMRIEPSKTISPPSVVPDGDKQIRIDIQIKGVED